MELPDKLHHRGRNVSDAAVTNEVSISVVINKEDLMGVPEKNVKVKRFKGQIWMMGEAVTYLENKNVWMVTDESVASSHVFFVCKQRVFRECLYTKMVTVYQCEKFAKYLIMILVRYEGEANFMLWMVLIFQFQLKGITINIYCYSLIIRLLWEKEYCFIVNIQLLVGKIGMYQTNAPLFLTCIFVNYNHR